MNPDLYDKKMSELERAVSSIETQQQLAALKEQAANDRTGLEIKIIRGQVCLVFDRAASSIGMTAEQARGVGVELIRLANQLEGHLPRIHRPHRHKPKK